MVSGVNPPIKSYLSSLIVYEDKETHDKKTHGLQKMFDVYKNLRGISTEKAYFMHSWVYRTGGLSHIPSSYIIPNQFTGSSTASLFGWSGYSGEIIPSSVTFTSETYRDNTYYRISNYSYDKKFQKIDLPSGENNFNYHFASNSIKDFSQVSFGNNGDNFTSAFASTVIEKVPDIKCKSAAINCTSMFSGCTKLIDASTLFDGSKPTSITMTEMFKSCSNLIYPPSGLSTVNEIKTATSAFEGCSKLPEIDLSILLKGNEETTKMFAKCESLTAVTNGQLSEKLKNAADMFSGCKKLKSIPRDFFPNTYTSNVINIENMFNGCTELEITLDASKLWENTDIQWKAVGAFKGCVKIKNYDDIPPGWK